MQRMVRIASSALGFLACLSGAVLARAADTPPASAPLPASTAPASAPASAPAKTQAPSSKPITAPSSPAASTPSKSSTAAGTSTAKKTRPKPSHYAPDRFAGRAGLNYRLVWGIDSMFVRLVESGELVRFTYRVLEPDKARVLNDVQYSASLNDPKAGVSLVVPTMEKVGALRQTPTPEAGRSYWVTFSNKGRRVKRGDRVDVVIGQFKANNLVVD